MKKIFTVLVLFMLGNNLFSTTKNNFCLDCSSTVSNDSFKCYAFASKREDGEWSDLVDCNIDGVFDYKLNSIYVYCRNTQVFDYKKITRVANDKSVLYYGDMVDLSGREVYVTIIICSDGLKMIHFRYPQGEFIYLVDKLPIK